MDCIELDLSALFAELHQRSAANASAAIGCSLLYATPDKAALYERVVTSTETALLALAAAQLGMPAADLRTKYDAFWLAEDAALQAWLDA